MTSISAHEGAPLEVLYRDWLDGSIPDDIAQRIIRTRGEMAKTFLAIETAQMSEQDLNEGLTRLKAAQEENPDLDPARDLAEREIARVQAIAMQAELDRRARAARAARDGDLFLPSRSDVRDRMISVLDAMGRGSQFMPVVDLVRRSVLGAQPGSKQGYTVLRQVAELRTPGEPEINHLNAIRLSSQFMPVVDIVLRSVVNVQPGSKQVYTVLRQVAELRTPGEPEINPWVRTALALHLLSDQPPWQSQGKPTVPDLEIHDVTLPQARRAWRIFFAEDRQDPRDEADDWPLDMDGEEVADIFHDAIVCSILWSKRGISQVEREAYIVPGRREEVGRPEPSRWIETEEESMKYAHRAGGFPVPMVMFISPENRAAEARKIWEDGIPEVDRDKEDRALEYGISVYSAPGDPRVRWGAPPYPHGLLCALAIRPDDILHLGRPGWEDHEELFNELSEQARSRSPAHEKHITRKLLMQKGFEAIGRYDYSDERIDVPQEVIILEPRPENLMVIREAVPPFMQED